MNRPVCDQTGKSGRFVNRPYKPLLDRGVEGVREFSSDIDELPKNWAQGRLNDVCNTTSGGTPSRKNLAFYGGEIPWVKSGELPDGLVLEIEERISEEAVASSSAKVFPSGTLLVAMYGATVGKLGVLTCDAATNQAVCAIFPSESLGNKYLFWYLRAVRSELVSQAVGGAQPNISQTILRELSIPLAPINEQTRIVAEIEKQFSRLDEAVANLKRVKVNLKRYKAAVLKAAVEGKLTEEWRRRGDACVARLAGNDQGEACPALTKPIETGAELLERILADRRKAAGKGKYKEPVGPDTSGLPELPAGWVVASLEQITSAERVICYGILMPKENIPDGIPYVKVKDMKGDKIDILGLHRTTPKIAEEYKRASLKAGDILLSIRGTYGRVAEVPPELEGGNITQDTARLVVLPPIARDFVSLQLRANDMQIYFKRVARGVAVKGVNIGDVRPAPFFLPPLAEQHQIVAEVERRLSIVAGAEAQVDANLRRAGRLRQSILKQAFSGQLVPQDPTDEPASSLLERIRNCVGAIHESPVLKSPALASPALESPTRVRHKQNRAIHESPLRKPRQSVEPKPAAPEFISLDSTLTAILDLMQPGREYARADLADPLDLTNGRWNVAIQELKRRGNVRQVGEKRGARYVFVNAGGGGA